MFRIERDSDGGVANRRLIGRIQSDGIACIRRQWLTAALSRHSMWEVTLMDVGVIRFLITREDEGMELAQCPPGVREWMVRERTERLYPR
jgi:hypothetical protein